MTFPSGPSRFRWTELVPPVLAAATLALSAETAAAQFFHRELPCGQTVPQRLAKLGVAPGAVSGTLTEEEWHFGPSRDVFLGWIVWLDMKTCKGRLVVRLSSLCVVEDVYTTGACNLRGLRRGG